MTRLIDADKLLTAYGIGLETAVKYPIGDGHGYGTMMLYEIRDMIDEAPTVDAVEVVRCKDCKQWSDYAPITTEHIKYCEYGKYMTGELGYCFYAERKEK